MAACHDPSGHLRTIMGEHSDMDEHKVEWAKRAPVMDKANNFGRLFPQSGRKEWNQAPKYKIATHEENAMEASLGTFPVSD